MKKRHTKEDWNQTQLIHLSQALAAGYGTTPAIAPAVKPADQDQPARANDWTTDALVALSEAVGRGCFPWL